MRTYAGSVDEGVREALLALAAGTAAVAGKSLSVGQRAARLGHQLGVVRGGQRFRVACSCGWSTDARWTRKRTMEAAAQHAIDVVNGVSLPGAVGGGL